MTHPVRAFAHQLANTRPFSRFRSLEERFGIAFFTLMLLVVTTHSLWAHEFKIGAIEIGHPWSRATPSGARVAAGYLKLTNSGSEPDRLVSASAEIAGKAEIHEMSVNAEGVMTMRPVPDGIEVPAGGEVELKPGGFHIMFLELKQPAVEGRKFAGTLTFEKAGTVEVEFAVDAAAPAAGGHAHGG